MEKGRPSGIRRAGFGLVLAALCVFSVNAAAQAPGERPEQPQHGDFDLTVFDAKNKFANPPLPLKVINSGGLDISRGTVERKRLQLQLSYPLTLTMGSTTAAMGTGGNVVGLDATLEMPLSQSRVGNVTMTGGVIRQMDQQQFQTLGNIECLNGTLSESSYTASGCRFVNSEFGGLKRRQIEFGSRFDTGSTSTSISWFTQDSAWNSSTVRNYRGINANSGLNAASLAPLVTPPLASANAREPLPGFDGNLSGVDLSFQLGVSTDRAGDVRFGLEFTRVLDGRYQGFYNDGLYAGSEAALPWKLAKPFDSARVNIGWSRGAFSSGIQGYYREPVSFLNRGTLNDSTTFDVHFTWRAPWNANLSVGATNVLNAATADSPANDNQPVDPFESIYGRIPYVRYQQDL